MRRQAFPVRNSAAWSGSADWRSPTTQPKPGFGAVTAGRHHAVGAVERAGHDLDPGRRRCGESSAACRRRRRNRARRSTRSGTQPACRGSRRSPSCSMSAKDANGAPVAFWHIRQWQMLILAGRRRHRKAHGAALAAAGQNGFGRRRHAHSIRRQASCNVASASPPAKMKSLTPAARSAGLLFAGPACQIDMLCAGGLKGLRRGRRVFRHRPCRTSTGRQRPRRRP